MPIEQTVRIAQVYTPNGFRAQRYCVMLTNGEPTDIKYIECDSKKDDYGWHKPAAEDEAKKWAAFLGYKLDLK